MIYLIFKTHKIFFEKSFFMTAVTSLFSISYLFLQCSNSQQNTMIHEQSTLYFFLSDTRQGFTCIICCFFAVRVEFVRPHYHTNLTFTNNAQLCRLCTGAQTTAQTPSPAHSNHQNSSRFSVSYALFNCTRF